ncbi:MAG TPA: AAA family ATPase, partial [Solirubrobacteraceae bacterium]|nr:AAA family ATPase [Solirubrobacteraceae bacterium]
RIVTVAGAKGGVGTSTVAMHLALTAQAGEAGSVCLVDFDLQTGDLRAYLNLPHRRSVVDLVDVADELSLRHLNETLFTHRTGVSVLLAPDEGELAEDVKVDVARNVLAALRTRHDLVIVDAGAAIGDASAAAVELADLVLLVTTPDVPSLRGARRMLDLWERLQITSSDTRLLINRHSRQREVQGRLVRTYVDRPTVETKLPASFSALEDAANTGTPERVEDKGLVKAFRALAQELELIAPSSGKRRAPAPQVVDDAADPDAPPPSKPGLLSRLAGERGQASVETVAILPIVIVVGLLMWQIGLIGYTFILAGQSAREGARALAVGDDEAERIREDVPGAWRDGLRCDIGDDRVKVSLAVPVLVPGVETNVRIASSAGTSVEDDAVGSPERGDDRFKPKSAKQDPCADKDKSKKKKDAEDSEA